MQRLFAGDSSYQPLYAMVNAPVRSHLLLAGIDLGIFDRTTVFRSARDVAQSLGTHQGNTVRLLDALTTLGLLVKRDGLYCNRSEAAAFLVSDSPTYLGDYLRMVDEVRRKSLDGIVERVRNGPCGEVTDKEFESEKLWAELARINAGWVAGGVGLQLATVVSGLPEFSGFTKMLDLGGGHGMFALSFVHVHPSMSAVVFDRPKVVSAAGEFIRKYGMQERVSVMAGDYMRDDIGTGYDFIWVCAALNFVRDELDVIVSRMLDALNPGGVCVSLHDGMTRERTQPDIWLGHMGEAMRLGRDFTFDQGEIAQAMLRCGFASVRSRTIRIPQGEMDLDIAYKAM